MGDVFEQLADKFEQPRKRSPRKNPWTPVACEECGAETTEPRKGLCPSCYQRRRRGSPAVVGAECVGCGEADVRVLKSFTLGDQAVAVCWNCGHRARFAKPRPQTVEELRQLVRRPGDRRRRRRDRRAGVDRRGQMGDRRYERPGVGDRRVREDRRAS